MADEDLSVLTRQAKAPDLTLVYGEQQDQVAEIRYGRHGAARPLVILIHGGFWKPRYDRSHTGAMADALAEAGWSVLTTEYRRIPGLPDATLQDVASASATLPGRVTQHNGSIVLVGHSAGGHLALWAAAKAAPAQLMGVLALAPVADLQQADRLNLGDGAVRLFLGTEPAQRPDVDPLLLPRPAAAVTIVQGEADAIVPASVGQAYCRAFPDTRWVTLPDCGHFAVIDPISQAWSTVVEQLEMLGHPTR